MPTDAQLFPDPSCDSAPSVNTALKPASAESLAPISTRTDSEMIISTPAVSTTTDQEMSPGELLSLVLRTKSLIGLDEDARYLALRLIRDSRVAYLPEFELDLLVQDAALSASMARLVLGEASVEDEHALVEAGYLIGDRAYNDAVVRLRPDPEHDKPIRYKKGYVNDYGMSEYEYGLSEEYNLLVNVFRTIHRTFPDRTYTTNDVRRFIATVEREVQAWLFRGGDAYGSEGEARSEVARERAVRPSDLRIKYPLNAIFDQRAGDGENIPEKWLDDCNEWGCALEWDINERLVSEFARQMRWSTSSNVFQIDHYKLAAAIAATRD